MVRRNQRAITRGSPEFVAYATNYEPAKIEVNKKMKLLPEHVVAARGLLKMSTADLGKAAGVSDRTIQRFETGAPFLKEDTLWRIQTALEERGIEFMNSGKPGVRYNPEKAIIPLGR